jgi:hypothetical protein
MAMPFNQPSSTRGPNFYTLPGKQSKEKGIEQALDTYHISPAMALLYFSRFQQAMY